MNGNVSVPLAGWTVPRPVFKRLEEIGGPTGEVVSLATVKAHLRITDTSADSYLTDMLIPAAIDAVQRYTNRRLLLQTVAMWMDFLPGTGNENTLYGAGTAQIPVRYANIGMFRWFELFGAPVASVQSFHFITNDGAEVTFDPSQYIADTADKDMPARIILQRGTVWPVDLQVAHSLKVSYTLGYTNAAAIPASLKHAVLLIAAALWSNRGDNADQQPDILGFPAVRALLDPYRVLRVSLL